MILAAAVWGTLPTWILVALAFAAAWRISRGGGGSAVSELSKANEVLTRRVHELGAEVRDLKVENAELKARTDVSLVIEPAAQRVIDATRASLAEHEARAIERHGALMHESASQLNVLGMIADQLGREAA